MTVPSDGARQAPSRGAWPRRGALLAGASACLLVVVVVYMLGTREPPAVRVRQDGTTKAVLLHIARGAALKPQHIRSNDFRAAIAEYREAVRIDPGSRLARRCLAATLHQSGNDAEAIPLWRSLAGLDDEHGRAARTWLRKVGASP